MKHDDGHRYRWKRGDWTDDSDQMILILRMLLDCNGKVCISYLMLHNIIFKRSDSTQLSLQCAGADPDILKSGQMAQTKKMTHAAIPKAS